MASDPSDKLDTSVSSTKFADSSVHSGAVYKGSGGYDEGGFKGTDAERDTSSEFQVTTSAGRGGGSSC